MEQDVLQLGNAGVELALLVFGLVILAVFRQVTEASGLLDELCDLVGTGGLAVIQLLFQLVVPLLTHFEFFYHGIHSFLLTNTAWPHEISINTITKIVQTLYHSAL